MIKDHTTLLKGSVVHSLNNTYSLNMFEHNIFVFIFRSKMMTIKDEDNYDGTFSFDSLFEQNDCFNKFLFILGTSQKGTISWALYDGIRIVN